VRIGGRWEGGGERGLIWQVAGSGETLSREKERERERERDGDILTGISKERDSEMEGNGKKGGRERKREKERMIETQERK